MHRLRTRETALRRHRVHGAQPVDGRQHGRELRQRQIRRHRRPGRPQLHRRRRPGRRQPRPRRGQPLRPNPHRLQQWLHRQRQGAERVGDDVLVQRHLHLVARKHRTQTREEVLLVHRGQRLHGEPAPMHGLLTGSAAIAIDVRAKCVRPLNGNRAGCRQSSQHRRLIALKADRVEPAVEEVQLRR